MVTVSINIDWLIAAADAQSTARRGYCMSSDSEDELTVAVALLSFNYVYCVTFTLAER
jgi:hypothetical protein